MLAVFHKVNMAGVGFLTCRGFDEYKTNDKKLLELCQERNIPAEWVVWDEPPADWHKYRAIVVLSTWDYYTPEKIKKFLSTLQTIYEAKVPLYNSFDLLSWNHKKNYLVDLAKKGIHIPDTLWVAADKLRCLPQMIQEQKWKECVLKPVISAGGNHTYRFQSSQASEILAECEPLHLDWMVQPFLEEIVSEGEWSFIFIEGAFSHALLKKPAPGEFRVQPFRDATVTQPEPEKWMVEEAKRILNACPGRPLHARVDFIRRDQTAVLMEVELIEPYLYEYLERGLSESFLSALVSRLGKLNLSSLVFERGLPPASFYSKGWVGEPLLDVFKGTHLFSFLPKPDPEISLMAQEGKEVIGQCAANKAIAYWRSTEELNPNEKDLSARTFIAIHKKAVRVEQEYLEQMGIPQEKALHNAGVAVLPEYRGNRLGIKMVEQQIALGKENRMEALFYESTGRYSANIARFLGFQKLAEYLYRDLAEELGCPDLSRLEDSFIVWGLKI